jgi:hypothetical protein
VPRGVLPEAHGDEHERQRDEHADHGMEPPRGPVEVAHDDEQQREGDVEEDRLLDRLVEIGRVRRLGRVEDDRGGQEHLQQAGRPRRGRVRAEPRHGPRQAARGDHEVERDEQVGRLAPGLDRHAEGQRRDGAQGQHPRPPGEQHGERDADDEGGDRAGAERDEGALTGEGELRRLPDLHDEQQRGEHERGEHADRADARPRRHHRGGRQPREHDDAERPDEVRRDGGASGGHHGHRSRSVIRT